MTVNKRMDAPSPPGPWVNEEACDCGEQYHTFIAKVTWQDGVDAVRIHNRGAYNDGSADGGFRSRGPVLWAMRVRKLHLWYERHQYCPEAIQHNMEDTETDSFDFNIEYCDDDLPF